MSSPAKAAGGRVNASFNSEHNKQTVKQSRITRSSANGANAEKKKKTPGVCDLITRHTAFFGTRNAIKARSWPFCEGHRQGLVPPKKHTLPVYDGGDVDPCGWTAGSVSVAGLCSRTRLERDMGY